MNFSSGFVDKENIKIYQPFRERYASKCQNNSNFRRAVDEVDSIISNSQKNSSNTVEMTEKLNKTGDDNDDNDDDAKSSSSLEYVNTVLLPPSDEVQNPNVLFDQISKQIEKMLNATLSNTDQTEDMRFEMNVNQPHSVKVAKIPPNGSCLFGSIVHQLFGHKINSDEHVQATKQMRLNVVEYISKHYSSFESALQCRVEEEEINLKEIEDNKKACQIFLNEYLSRDNYWGGHETVQAVQEMYGVNILIFREQSSYNYFYRFNEPNTRILILAYRLGNKLNLNSHNHYDSVCKIDTDGIWNIAEFLWKRQQIYGQ